MTNSPSTAVFRFALIGCGRIGQVHAREIQRVGRLIAVCDTDASRLEAIADGESMGRYLSLSDLLEKEKAIDVVVIATPNGLHAVQSIEALQAGLNVLCEKPMAINSEDAEAMILAARNFGKQLVVVKQNRYNPPIQQLKQLLDEGRLGKILSFQVNAFWSRKPAYYQQSAWRGTKALDGGTLYTQFSHFVDLLIWFFGDLKEVKGYLTNANHPELIEFEDQGALSLLFKSDISGTLNYTVNAFNENMEGSITVFGENGTVKVGGAYLNEMSYFNVEGVEKSLPAERRVANQPPNQYGEYQGSMSNHPLVYDDLIRLLNGLPSSSATPEDGLRTIRAIEKIYQSANVI